jgi:hypothetical protein
LMALQADASSQLEIPRKGWPWQNIGFAREQHDVTHSVAVFLVLELSNACLGSFWDIAEDIAPMCCHSNSRCSLSESFLCRFMSDACPQKGEGDALRCLATRVWVSIHREPYSRKARLVACQTSAMQPRMMSGLTFHKLVVVHLIIRRICLWQFVALRLIYACLETA